MSGTPVEFVATATNGLGPFTYDWNFGDGSQLSASANASHTYDGSGMYRVSVGVTDQLGEIVTRTAEVQVVRPLTVALVANESSVTVGSAVHLDAEVAGGAAPVTESWSGLPTGCPSSPTGLTVTCTPTATGTYHVQVRVDDSAGESRTANATVVVSAPTTPAGIAASATTWLEIGAVVAVVVGALLVTVLLWRRRAPPRS
ncbi:MAG: PKD domain-containing protein [Candidatus Lutacidiplasmatales archaeon]